MSENPRPNSLDLGKNPANRTAGTGGNTDRAPLPANQLLADARKLAEECHALGNRVYDTLKDLRLASLAWRVSGELLAIGDALEGRYVDRNR